MRRLNLTRMGQRMPEEERPFPGDRCRVDGCVGVLVVYTTRIEGEYRVRYLQCSACHTKPDGNKMVNRLDD